MSVRKCLTRLHLFLPERVHFVCGLLVFCLLGYGFNNGRKTRKQAWSGWVVQKSRGRQRVRKRGGREGERNHLGFAVCFYKDYFILRPA